MPRSHFDHCANPHFLKALLNNFECIPDSFVQTMKMSFQTKCWEGSKWLRIPDSWLCNRWQFNFLSSLFKEWKQWMNCKLRRCELSNNSVIVKIARCLKFTEKVSFYNVVNFDEYLKLDVKQCYQTGQSFKRTKIGGKCQIMKFEWDNLNDFQTMWNCLNFNFII